MVKKTRNVHFSKKQFFIYFKSNKKLWLSLSWKMYLWFWAWTILHEVIIFQVFGNYFWTQELICCDFSKNGYSHWQFCRPIQTSFLILGQSMYQGLYRDTCTLLQCKTVQVKVSYISFLCDSSQYMFHPLVPQHSTLECTVEKNREQDLSGWLNKLQLSCFQQIIGYNSVLLVAFSNDTLMNSFIQKTWLRVRFLIIIVIFVIVCKHIYTLQIRIKNGTKSIQAFCF